MRDLEIRLSEMIADFTLGGVLLPETQHTFVDENKALKSGHYVPHVPHLVLMRVGSLDT